MDAGADALTGPPVRKRRHVTSKAGKAFKKDFDLPLSTLLGHTPSSLKCTPFKSMVAGWWLQSDPNTKYLDGAAWLVGFYARLKEEDLHPIDREYLKELVAWHQEKGELNSITDDTPRHAGSPCQTGDV